MNKHVPLIRALVKHSRQGWNIRDSHFLFPFVFWFSLLITVLFRQYLWVLSYPLSYNHSLIRVFDKPLFPLPSLAQNGSYQNIFTRSFQISLADPNQNNTEIPDLSQLTQIELIGALEKGSLTKISPYFILRNAQITAFSTRPAGAQRVIYPLSHRLRSLADSFVLNLSASLPSTEASLAAGIFLGGNQRFSYQFRENIRRAGLLHLTVVSGYNITVLIGSAIVIFKLLGNRLLIIPGVIISIIFFTLITGGGASVIRAALMGTVGFLALQAGSIRSTKRIFVLVALFMLILKPAWLWDVGWELSAAATASLIWIEPIIYRFVVFVRHFVIPRLLIRYPEAPRRIQLAMRSGRSDINNSSLSLADLPAGQVGSLDSSSPTPQNDDRNHEKSTLIESFSASLSAYLATFPILVWRLGWNSISWVGIFTNVPAAFLVPWIMALGALVGFAGLASLPLAHFLAVIGRPPIWVLVKIIEWGARLNQLL